MNARHRTRVLSDLQHHLVTCDSASDGCLDALDILAEVSALAEAERRGAAQALDWALLNLSAVAITTRGAARARAVLAKLKEAQE